MDTSSLVTLAHGPLRLTLAPSLGGAIAGFRHEGVAILRETPPEALAQNLVRQTSSYPLIPYSNRIAWARFAFEGVDYALARNFGDHPHSVHGNAWQRSWRVDDVTPSSCRLVFEHRPIGPEAANWPFAYRAEQFFSLDAGGLTIRLSLENEDGRAMPAGLGLHPFFPKRPDTGLRFAAAGVHINGPDSLPVHLDPVPPEWDYAALRSLGEPQLDNCFSGWDGTAEIRFEDDNLALRMSADPVFGHLVVYVPSGRDYFAVEPVTHMNDAIHHPEIQGHGLKVVQPGETLSGAVRFQVERIR
ncbi:aldose 1-epimerase [Microvirga pudoricolor]|uniref:aldose 1-epimerase n=1 Tax=Microvirga pudoricolor TaxID=2778729 RepID=UPI00194E8871|nr:aldose 1-epimerase [Microvirga pudoricolor]MBM6596339.1 aldose 1-epimerase [Microvirga pudoricolor]